MKKQQIHQPSIAEQQDFWNEWNAKYREQAILDHASIRRAKVCFGLFKSLGLNKPQILELGCATGWMSEQLAEFGPVTALDLADDVIARAKQRAPHVHFLAGDVMKIDLQEGHFDVVFCLETIPYLVDQAGFVKRMASWLKPNGYLILTCQNKFILKRVDVAPQAQGQVRQWLNRRELRRLISMRFDLLKMTTIGPEGRRGMLGVVNSRRINALLQRFLTEASIQSVKEWAGLGRTIVVLARTRPFATR
jgi:2-polyprenyl-3-methyl-5-hydroxy-6-metoxy-1,4-benzoquinol methylase